MAARDDKTSYAFANECLGAALKICEKGGQPEEIYGAWEMNRIGKDVGAFQWVGRNLMEQLVRQFGMLQPEKFSQMWREAGYNFGVYLQICFPAIEDVVSLAAQLKQSFNIGRNRNGGKSTDLSARRSGFCGQRRCIVFCRTPNLSCRVPGAVSFLPTGSKSWRTILRWAP